MLKLIQFFATVFKGNDYKIDSNIRTSDLIEITLTRVVGLIRCILKGIKISPKVNNLGFVGSNVKFRSKHNIRFGKRFTLGDGVQINGLSFNGIDIGDDVSIGQYTIIEATGVITSLGSGVTIGDNTGIGAFSFIGAAGGVKIGSDVIMGQRVSFHSENHLFSDYEIPIRKQGVTRKGIVIEDNCWVGANVTFLDGAYVSTGCVIAAGAVVTGHIPINSVAAGVPAKVLKQR